MRPEQFIRAVSSTVPTPRPPTRLAVVDATYNPATYPGTLPRVTFEGETELSTRPLVVIGTVPSPGDRVLCLASGDTYAIVGPVAASAWRTYVPAWTGSITNPTNGTIAGSWARSGRSVECAGRVLMGASTTYGSGSWSVSLPVPANTATHAVGSVAFVDISAGQGYSGICRLEDANKLTIYSSTGTVGPAAPFTWANGDSFRWSIRYESAT